MNIDECITKIVDEKSNANIPDKIIYSHFVKPIHYLQAAKDVLSRDSIFAKETAIDFYDAARGKIGIINQEPHQELHSMIHSLSLYAQRLLKYQKCDEELPEMHKNKIHNSYEKLNATQKFIVDFYFSEQLTQLKQDIIE